MELTSVEIRAGQLVKARQKRAGQPAHEVVIEVHATVVRQGRPYLVGTNLDLTNGGGFMAVRADTFDPRCLVVEDVGDFDKDAFDPDAYFITAGNASFQFLEEVAPEDREWAAMVDGQPVSELQVEYVRATVVVDQKEPEPTDS
jgi:hypothetical protein